MMLAEGDEVVCRDGRVGTVVSSTHPAVAFGRFVLLRAWWGHMFLVRPDDILDDE